MQNYLFDIKSLGTIAKTNKKFQTELAPYLAKQLWSPSDRKQILDKLSVLLITSDPNTAVHVASLLGPLSTELVHRFKTNLLNKESKKKLPMIADDDWKIVEKFCVTLGALIEAGIPDVNRFAVEFFCEVKHPFKRLLSELDTSLSPSLNKKRKLTTCEPDEDLFYGIFQILKACPIILKYNWPWKDLVNFINKTDKMLSSRERWALMNLMAMVLQLPRKDVKAMEECCLSEADLLKLHYVNSAGINMNESISAEQHVKYSVSEQPQSYTKKAISSSDLDSNSVTVCGVTLSKDKNTDGDLSIPKSEYILTPSMEEHMHSVALAVAHGHPVFLKGPVGCGKSALVEYLAKITGRTSSNFMKVQLGDGMDSKVLTGTYICTAIPGEFVWQLGALAQAVKNGSWILLEDIDKAPLDVISLLLPLLETGSLKIHGHSTASDDQNAFISSGFRLFMTQRTYGSTQDSTMSESLSGIAMLARHSRSINMSGISSSELKTIIVAKFPPLMNVIDKILLIYSELITASESDFMGTNMNKRKPSIRDLFKLCNRISSHLNQRSSEAGIGPLFVMDTVDCFIASSMDEKEKTAQIHLVHSHLNLSTKHAEYFCQSYKPEVEIQSNTITFGRAKLNKMKSHTLLKHANQPFALTRHSLTLLERVSCAVAAYEPVLLVGETGVGKTSVVQYMAEQLGCNLRILNMSQQSSSSDLLGSFKPAQPRHLVAPVREEFERLFLQSFSQKQNAKFLEHIQTCYLNKRYNDLLQLMSHCSKIALKKFSTSRKDGDEPKQELVKYWEELDSQVNTLKQQLKVQSTLAFTFVEGILSQALKKGDWLLLDEINLASPETLDCLSSVLESQYGSVSLLEIGDATPLKRHPDFRIFAAMNPATDVGKKNLPLSVRNRFLELYVPEPSDDDDLRVLISYYLRRKIVINPTIVNGILLFYQQVRKLSSTTLVDGMGRRPHFSLRTLCRALRFVADNPAMQLHQAIYEGLCLSFLTELDHSAHTTVVNLIISNVLGKRKAKGILKTPMPTPMHDHVTVERYHIRRGELDPCEDSKYIITPYVKKNMKILARAISYGKYPILIQGETSTGKTSIIRYMAKLSGNVVTRINNHEHTDLQEYVGCYVSDSSGKLIFQEGPLVTAMRKGHWIILDELNLAPTDILESLNRVLDDNRELYIPEIQERVSAHPRFTLFATQNPPGTYGGRKVLSRALRNRFIELHFGEIPSEEIETILHQRCDLPVSRCKRLVKVMEDLQAHRRSTGIFAGKHGFITLRDLFRWAERYRQDQVQTAPGVQSSYDWDQHLANDGYMLLAGHVRKPDEEKLIKEVIQKHIGKKINPGDLFSYEAALQLLGGCVPDDFKHIVLTKSLRRMYILLHRSLKFDEPVLLVGETGCGKTTACQMFSAIHNSSGEKLAIINCHLHTDASDFLGGLRPVRHHTEEKESQTLKLFEWVDGPLVKSMTTGSNILIDEISLAEDSVLERLNSILEPERALVIPDKVNTTEKQSSITISAKQGFQFMATMNPGGDFGKKELSPALRNRLTEIWCTAVDESEEDVKAIVKHNLEMPASEAELFAQLIVDFVKWFRSTTFGSRHVKSIRDIMNWVKFMNGTTQSRIALEPVSSYVHAALLVYIDGIGSGLSGSFADQSREARTSCINFIIKLLHDYKLYGNISQQCKNHMQSVAQSSDHFDRDCVSWTDGYFGVAPFYIQTGPNVNKDLQGYSFSAPTTSSNTLRLLRALQLNRPILLEGSPGIGKTSLVTALAKAAGHNLVRINLSEQTDTSDLFGADLPVEDGVGGQFRWHDGPLLSALKSGSWIVFDELNLASQSVLEGLNSVFDHRAEIFIPELGCTFHVNPKSTRIFACQNPLQQGGGRKGLPKSFLNRFTQVYWEPLSVDDLTFILTSKFSEIPVDLLSKMIHFNAKVNDEVIDKRSWGQLGAPSEFNLRDMSRWCEIMQTKKCFHPEDFFYLIYCERLQTQKDREHMCELFKEVFPDAVIYLPSRRFHLSPESLQVGNATMRRSGTSTTLSAQNLQIIPSMLHPMESLMNVLNQGWMCILTGPSGAGKSSLVSTLAAMTGHKLRVFPVNSSMDTTELLGGFEQADFVRNLYEVICKASSLMVILVRHCYIKNIKSRESLKSTESALKVMEDISKYKSILESSDSVVTTARSFCADLQSITNSVSAEDATISELRDLLIQAERITSRIEINIKGTYEWNNSILIDALTKGDWLLIDGANLCNPSVLDRLNALLEPNGILSVTERGVIDGEIVNIHPHSSFRLILSMDSSRGNLSRAMRNRGVEIHLLCCGSELQNLVEEISHSCLTWEDVRRMLSFKVSRTPSINSELHQHIASCLVSIFEEEYITDCQNTRTMMKCLQCFAEITEELGIGNDIESSVLPTCAKYLKEREEKAKLMENLRNSLLVDMVSNTHLPVMSVEKMVFNSTSACVFQQAQFLDELHSQSLSNGLDFAQFLSAACNVIVNICSLADHQHWIQLLSDYLKKYNLPTSENENDVHYNPDHMIGKFRFICEKVVFASKFFQGNQDKMKMLCSHEYKAELQYMPWDPRWSIQLLKTFGLCIDTECTALMNILALMVVLNSCQYEENVLLESRIKKQSATVKMRKTKIGKKVGKKIPEQNGILVLSALYHKGLVKLQSLPHPSIAYLYPLHQSISSYMIEILTMHEASIPTEDKFSEAKSLVWQLSYLWRYFMEWRSFDITLFALQFKLLESWVRAFSKCSFGKDIKRAEERFILAKKYFKVMADFLDSDTTNLDDIQVRDEIRLAVTQQVITANPHQKREQVCLKSAAEEILHQIRKTWLKLDKQNHEDDETILRCKQIVHFNFVKICEILAKLRVDRNFCNVGSEYCLGYKLSQELSPEPEANLSLSTISDELSEMCANIQGQLAKVGHQIDFKSVSLIDAGITVNTETLEAAMESKQKGKDMYSSTLLPLAHYYSTQELTGVLFLLKNGLDNGKEPYEFLTNLFGNICKFLNTHQVANTNLFTSFYTLISVMKMSDKMTNANADTFIPVIRQVLLTLLVMVNEPVSLEESKLTANTISTSKPFLAHSVLQAIHEGIPDGNCPVLSSSYKGNHELPLVLLSPSTLHVWDNVNVTLMQCAPKRTQLLLLRNMLWTNNSSCCVMRNGEPARRLNVIDDESMIRSVCIFLAYFSAQLKVLSDAQIKNSNILNDKILQILKNIQIEIKPSMIEKTGDMEDVLHKGLHQFNCQLTVMLEDGETEGMPTSSCFKHSQEHLMEALTCILKLFKNIFVSIQELCGYEKKRRILSAWLCLSQAWIWTGSFSFSLFAPQHDLDPVEKYKSECEILQHKLTTVTHEIEAYSVYYKSMTGLQLHLGNELLVPVDILHPRVSARMKHKEEITRKIEKTNSKVAYRPSSQKFKQLRRECMEFESSVISFTNLSNILSSCCDLLQNEDETTMMNVLHTFSSMVQKIVNSVVLFSTKLQEYPAFPDYAVPMQDALNALCFGFQLTQDSVAVIACPTFHFKSDLTLEQFFSALMSCDAGISCPPLTLINYARSIQEQNIYDGNSNDLSEAAENSGKFSNLVENVVVTILLHYRNQILLQGSSAECMDDLFNVLSWVIEEWNKKQAEIAQKEDEKSSLYKPQQHLNLPNEEEQEEIEFKSAFPEFTEDISEHEEPDASECTKQNASVDAASGHLSDRVWEVAMLVHRDVMRLAGTIDAHILPVDKLEDSETNIKKKKVVKDQGNENSATSSSTSSQCINLFLRVLYANHNFQALFQSMYTGMLKVELDDVLRESNLIVAKRLEEYLGGNMASPSNSMNIYRESSVQKASSCVPVLLELQTHVKQALMSEWPEHPTLNKILLIIDRILGFSVSSPLMKYVAGLEILLSTMQEWEKNASSRVSLQSFLEKITKIVLDWRKIELKSWNRLLCEVVSKKSAIKPSLYFGIYQLVQDNTGENISEDVISSLGQFMESSTIIEFKSRLEVLSTFLQHLELTGQKHSPMVRILWNTLKYYSQFCDAVSSRIDDLRKPIAKELRDFVKIAKWNDINFYAVKDSVEKTQRHLFKLVKKFSGAISENVRVRVLVGDVDIMKDNHEIRKPDFQQGVSTESVIDTESCVGLIQFLESEIYKANKQNYPLLFRLTSLLPKLGNYGQEWRSSSSEKIWENLSTMEELISEIITTANHLRELQPSTPAGDKKDKETHAKRLSEAKSIQLRKRKALDDLFKYLTQIGLSYRKGIIYGRDLTSSKLLQSATCKSSVLNEQTVAIESPSPGVIILNLEQISSENLSDYFFRSMSRWSTMSIALNTPHKDLTRMNLDRSRGYIGHLMTLSLRQRKWISDVSVYKKCIEDALYSIRACSLSAFPPAQTECITLIKNMKKSMDNWCFVLHRFYVWLDCCPPKNEEIPMVSPSTEYFLSKMEKMHHSDQEWIKAVEKVEKTLRLSHKGKSLLDAEVERIKQVNEGYLISKLVLDQVFKEMSSVFTHSLSLCDFITTLFSTPANLTRKSCPPVVLDLCNSSINMKSELEKLKKICEVEGYMEEDSHNLEETSVILTATDKLISGILVSVQNLKKCIETSAESNASDSALHNGHLTKLLHNNLHEQKKTLDIGSVCKKIQNFMKDIVQVTETKRLKVVELAMLSLIPVVQEFYYIVKLLNSLLLSMHRTTCKLCYILSGIFQELATKGFCPVADFEEELSGEGTTEFMDIDDAGMGEGEGKKDVSDQIENEEQVEDGVDEKDKQDEENNQDAPEAEDNAIEMSTDFDAEFGDEDQNQKQPDEDSDQESDDEEEELEKQMGDLGEEADADKLDERIWGSDNKEEEEQQSNPKEEKGKGMDKSQSELAAKDDALNQEMDSDIQQDEKQAPEEENDKDENKNDMSEFDPEERDDYHNEEDNSETKHEEGLELPEDIKVDEEEQEQEGEESNEQDSEKDVDNVVKEPEESEAQSKDEKDDSNEEKIDEESADTEIKEDEDVCSGEEAFEENGKEEENEENNSEESPPMNTAKQEEEDLPQDVDATQQDRESGVKQAGEEFVDEDNLEDNTKVEMNSSENKSNQEDKVELSDETLGKASAEDNQSKEESHGGGNAPNSDNIKDESMNLTSQVVSRNVTHESEETQSGKKPHLNDTKRAMDRDSNENTAKRLKTIETDQNEDQSKVPKELSDKPRGLTSDVYQHIEDSNAPYDQKTLETASEEQYLEKPEKNGAEKQEPSTKEEEYLDYKADEEMTVASTNLQDVKEVPGSMKEIFEMETNAENEDEELGEMKEKKENVLEQQILPASAVYTDLLQGAPAQQFHQRSEKEVNEIRQMLEKQLQSWKDSCNPIEIREAEILWRKYCSLTQPLALQLCEQLRLILEPTQAAQLKGDYRTGKRLNMRKVIPYIASGFRKDKIWLRRTKPSKRKYQVLLAVDDSSSMIDNHSKQLAFESVSVIANALSTLEVGQLAVCNFGENFQLLQDFDETFTDKSGASILAQCTFTQKKTKIAQFLDSSVSLLQGQQRNYSSNSHPNLAQLLLIISDGRGLYLEGRDRVIEAVRAVRVSRIFVAFIILDQPNDTVGSILDIKVPTFKEPGKMPEITSYMKDFPFPFYLILRDINALPHTLGEALRQWFELIAGSD